MMMSGDSNSDKDILVFNRKRENNANEDDVTYESRKYENDAARDESYDEYSSAVEKLLAKDKEYMAENIFDSFCYFFYCMML